MKFTFILICIYLDYFRVNYRHNATLFGICVWSLIWNSFSDLFLLHEFHFFFFFVECSSVWVWCFLMIIFRLCILTNYVYNKCCVVSFLMHLMKKYMIYVLLIVGKVNFDSLIKVMFARFLYSNIILSFIIDK